MAPVKSTIYLVYLESEGRNLRAFTTEEAAVKFMEERVDRTRRLYGANQAKIEHDDLCCEPLTLEG